MTVDGIQVEINGEKNILEVIKKLGATVRLKLLNYLETKDVYELANTDELNDDLKEKLKKEKKIEMLLRQEKFEPFSSQEILDRFEDFGE